MGTQTCAHGLAQRNKYGTEQRDGLEVCLGCGLPTPESAQAALAAGQRTASGPVEKARAARAAGQRFLEIQLEVSQSQRDVSFASADFGTRSDRDHGDVLGAIEAEGWTLDNVGYVFVPTGQSTRAKMLGSGESVAISGVTVGIYLFRAATEAGS